MMWWVILQQSNTLESNMFELAEIVFFLFCVNKWNVINDKRDANDKTLVNQKTFERQVLFVLIKIYLFLPSNQIFSDALNLYLIY